MSDEKAIGEYTYPFTCETHNFIGKKPAAVYFGAERIPAKKWTHVYAVIIERCNQQDHDALMYLRNKAAGKCRLFLSDSPDSMKRPLKIDDDLYGETHYGSATLMHILRDQILYYTGLDCSDISIAFQ